MTILLTGAGGFVGSYFQKAQKCVPMDVDIRNEGLLADFIKASKPSSVVHLAAQSFVPDSFSDPKSTFDINFGGTYNLLTALEANNFSGVLLFVSSGDTYGLVPEDKLPITEPMPLKPRSPYAVSKVAAEALCYQRSQTEKYKIVIARSFNHIGPGQSEKFAVSNFAKQIAEIKLGRKNPVIYVGDIDVTRDFIDVKDVVDAYVALLHRGRSGEVYNVCSGVDVSLRTILNKIVSFAEVEVAVQPSEEKFRHAEQRIVRVGPLADRAS